MISINKQGNAIVIEFTDNDKYLFNGKIEVAPNELIVVVDQSDMVTFKRASNGDVLFSQLVDDIQIAGSPVTKDTVIDQFALIGFTSGGGGGEPGAVSSVNGQTGDVIITPASLNVYTRAEVDNAINEETTERQKQDSALGGMIAAETAAREQAVASKQDILVSGQNIKTINGQSVLGSGNITIQGGTSNWNDIQGKPEFAEVATSGSYNDLTNKPEIPSDYIENITDSDTEFSIDTAFNYKSGKKYSLSFSKTGGFDVIIGGVGDTQRNINLSIDTDIIATKTELASKQDTLVSGTNIKTVNGQSLLGEGNIEIQGGGTVDSSLSTTSENPVQNKVITNAINGKQDAGDYALKSEIPDVSGLATKAELADKLDTATYNSEKANFATKEELAAKADASAIADMATQTWVTSQGYLTEIPSEYVTDSELTEALADKADKTGAEFTGTIAAPIVAFMRESQGMMGAIQADSNNILFRTYNAGVKSITFQVQNTAALKLTEAGIWENNQLLENKYAQLSDLNDFATTEQLNTKQDTLVSGTNIKTINGQTLLGEGNIEISSGGPVDTAMSDTSENAVQNKVIKKYIDDLVGNILTQLQEINGTN